MEPTPQPTAYARVPPASCLRQLVLTATSPHLLVGGGAFSGENSETEGTLGKAVATMEERLEPEHSHALAQENFRSARDCAGRMSSIGIVTNGEAMTQVSTRAVRLQMRTPSRRTCLDLVV